MFCIKDTKSSEYVNKKEKLYFIEVISYLISSPKSFKLGFVL